MGDIEVSTLSLYLGKYSVHICILYLNSKSYMYHEICSRDIFFLCQTIPSRDIEV